MTRADQTLTVFGLHTPHAPSAADPENIRQALTDANGLPCIEAKTTADLDATLKMTAGNIFHGGLSWPFVEDDEPLDTPARRRGVATDHDRIPLCGSGSRRGGAGAER